MLARANKEYEANAQSQRGNLSKQPSPAGSGNASTNSDIRDKFKKPGYTGSHAWSARTGNNERYGHQSPSRRGLGQRQLSTLYSYSDSFREETPKVSDRAKPDAKHKVDTKQEVFVCEDDFSDDEQLLLEIEAPVPLPPAPKKAEVNAKENMPPPPSAQSQQIECSSSPQSHWDNPKLHRSQSEIPNPSDSSRNRLSSGENATAEPPIAKKRKLPSHWSQSTQNVQASHEEEETKTPVHNRRTDFLDLSASALKEQKRQLKNQRQPPKPEQGNDGPKDDARKPDETEGDKVAPFTLSKEQIHVLDLVVHRNQSVFFTGPAGTGKSVLMRAIIDELKKKYARDPERVAVTASTGLAACNIGGITLHSFSGIGLGKEDAPTLVKKVRRNPKAKNRWLKVKCLIIDEVSMVDGDLFDKLSQIGRLIRNNGRPWGGIQLIITGDFFQLPPVPDSGKRDVKFAFDASTWSTSIDHTIGLTEVFRQRDPQFANMLNEMRLGKISPATEQAFRALARPLKFDDGVDMAQLFPTRAQVENSNASRLKALPGEARRFDAVDAGDPAVRDKLLQNMMAPQHLELKVGAQVMLIKNWDETLVNGSLGKVVAFSDEKGFEMSTGKDYDGDMGANMDKARKKLAGFSRDGSSGSSGQLYPVVQFISVHGTARVVLCQPEEWKVELPNGEVQAKRTQLPLILAWALSIHKAQGQTLERVTVDLGRVFEKGQAYVALSRATSQQGLQVLHFDRRKVMAHPRVCTFYSQLYSAAEAQAANMRPSSITDFINNRKGVSGAPPAKRRAIEVVDVEHAEEAMRAYGH